MTTKMIQDVFSDIKDVQRERNCDQESALMFLAKEERDPTIRANLLYVGAMAIAMHETLGEPQ